jgi:hypothetical protein
MGPAAPVVLIDMSPREQSMPVSPWVARLFLVAAVVLLPWVVLLAIVLPSTQRAAHWDLAWAGFDAILAILLLSVAITAWRRSPWLEGSATAAAALLLVDAWFDILTSSSRVELIAAVVEAALVEVPLAVLCIFLARAARRRLQFVGGRTYSAPGDGLAVGSD